MSLDKEFVDCNYNMGVLYMDLNRYSEAEHYFRVALEKRAE
ncbi:tetratricopeptide repeat protein [candidate division KSB1 bacterium]|nr:tetratricopeptide repeat protein [candidate division KSB1 bacterium]